jgi:hypothetical protein
MEFKFFDNVPVPERKPGAESKYAPLLKMKKGQSVMMETLNDAKAAQMLFSRNNMLATTRKQRNGGYMLWRVY